MFSRFQMVGFSIGAVALVALSLVSGCLDPPLKELNPCLFSGVIIDREVNKVDKIDLLFVVDNSQSMEQEQEKLRKQIPRMIKVLTTGDKTPDNGEENDDFPPVKDLHLAVVSSDMGLPKIPPEENPDQTLACNGTGDDGNFLNDTSVATSPEVGLNCGNYPPFLTHIREEREDPNVTLQKAQATADSFNCMATLGTGGCGFEMQLESPLKALWPSLASNLNPTQLALGIQFLDGSQGRGDGDHREFLRGTSYHPTEGDKLSLLAIIVVTDEEDCSAGALGNLDFLTLNFPGGDRRDLNLRCYKDTVGNWGNKYPVDRYIQGFKALRPQFEDLVVFAAIAGIPEIDEDANKDNDITPEERENYYNQILNHPMMQETPNPDTNNLNYSCQHDTSPGVYDTQAFPARRITQVAQGFGANGVIRSICADDFTPAMNAIIDVISNKIGGVCLPREFTRDSQGKVGCDIIWTMPPEYSCADYPYLESPPAEKPQQDEDGRAFCVVNQIAVSNPSSSNPAEAFDPDQPVKLGWYYDDFSEDMQRTCKTTSQVTTKQRISFTLNPGSQGQNEDPPAGVSIDLECLQQIPTPISDPNASIVGQSCEDVDDSGNVHERCPSVSSIDTDNPDGQLFCHDTSNVCVMYCRTDADCKRYNLAGWICDGRQNSDGSYKNKSSLPICVNPTCK